MITYLLINCIKRGSPKEEGTVCVFVVINKGIQNFIFIVVNIFLFFQLWFIQRKQGKFKRGNGAV
jgi:hypothetical protein